MTFKNLRNAVFELYLSKALIIKVVPEIEKGRTWQAVV